MVMFRKPVGVPVRFTSTKPEAVPESVEPETSPDLKVELPSLLTVTEELLTA